MILILKKIFDVAEKATLCKIIDSMGFLSKEIQIGDTTVIAIFGDTIEIATDVFSHNKIIAKIVRITEPYKLPSRLCKPYDTIISVKNQSVGNGSFAIFGGPCSVESEDQIMEIAVAVKENGGNFLRGGAFKPRSSPYAFDGLGIPGIKLLKKAGEAVGLPIVSEIMSNEYLNIFYENVDIIQIGARNMQNFTLLKEVGALQKPILLKRGMASTIDELLMAAEYLMIAGTDNVILCERGIRTFEVATRNTLDLSAVPVLKQKSHLPVIVDPSHATGRWELVKPMALAAVAAGADGVMVEVHNIPEAALSDSEQSINVKHFAELAVKIRKVYAAVNS